MKIWNTKYCLTTGITEHEAKECSEGMVGIANKSTRMGIYLHGEGLEWHRTRAGAIARAEAVREKKLELLNKQIKKLKGTNFFVSAGG